MPIDPHYTERLHLLDGVTLEVPSGQVVGLLRVDDLDTWGDPSWDLRVAEGHRGAVDMDLADDRALSELLDARLHHLARLFQQVRRVLRVVVPPLGEVHLAARLAVAAPTATVPPLTAPATAGRVPWTSPRLSQVRPAVWAVTARAGCQALAGEAWAPRSTSRPRVEAIAIGPTAASLATAS